MNVTKLFDFQRVLDKRINKEKSLESKELIRQTFLALDIELSELANETSCFKHWSVKPLSPKEVILDRYADCLKFFLSIAIQKGWQDAMYLHREAIEEFRENGLVGGTTSLFFEIKYFLIKSHMEKHPEDKEFVGFHLNAYWYRFAWSLFITLGLASFGFKEEQIEKVYYAKNEVNHQRQEQGY
jgi:dimeric dUTPase (all-alpha-NTP-PPase superfamily)